MSHPCCQVFVGCWRSVKPEPPPEAMTKKVRALGIVKSCMRGVVAAAAEPSRPILVNCCRLLPPRLLTPCSPGLLPAAPAATWHRTR